MQLNVCKYYADNKVDDGCSQSADNKADDAVEDGIFSLFDFTSVAGRSHVLNTTKDDDDNSNDTENTDDSIDDGLDIALKITIATENLVRVLHVVCQYG